LMGGSHSTASCAPIELRGVGDTQSSPKRRKLEPVSCSICLEFLHSPHLGVDSPPILHLSCGHAYHCSSCLDGGLARHIGSKIAEAKRQMQEHLRQRWEEIGLNEAERSRLVGGVNFVDLHAAGRLRQCPGCSYGPVLNTNCNNMYTHDNVRGAGPDRTTNSCPNCNFSSPNWSDWKVWDPEDLMASVRCPDCREVCALVPEDAPRVLAHAQDLREERSEIAVRWVGPLRSLGSVLFDTLMLASLSQSSPQCQPHEEFSRRILPLLEQMAHRPKDAVALLKPLLETASRCIPTGQSSSTSVGLETTSDPSTRLAQFSKAIHAVRELESLELKHERKRTEGALMLCIYISEELKSSLDEIIQPMVLEHASLQDDLHVLSWTAGCGDNASFGFRYVPSVAQLIQVLQSHMEVWSVASSAPTIFVQKTFRDAQVQTDEGFTWEDLQVSLRTCVDKLQDAAEQHNLDRNLGLLLRSADTSLTRDQMRLDLQVQAGGINRDGEDWEVRAFYGDAEGVMRMLHERGALSEAEHRRRSEMLIDDIHRLLSTHIQKCRDDDDDASVEELLRIQGVLRELRGEAMRDGAAFAAVVEYAQFLMKRISDG